MKQTNTTKGFSAIIGLVVILAVAGLGAGGWYVWEKNQKDTTTNPTNSQNSRSEVDRSESNGKVAESNKTLSIKEWDIRFTLSDAQANDVTAAINNKAAEAFGGPQRVDFYSRTFSSGSLKCDAADSTLRALVTIYAQKDAIAVSSEPKAFKTIDGTSYYMSKTACEEAIEREGSDQDKVLLQALKDTVTSTLQKEQ